MKHLFIIKDGWWILAVPQTTVQGGMSDRKIERQREKDRDGVRERET